MFLRRRLLLLAFAALVGLAQEPKQESEALAPYFPTPETIVDKMLQLGGLKAGEKMFDLGSGDGRIVIMAAQKYHADATGIEYDKDLARQSSDRIKSLNLQKTARIINGDILRQDVSSADLITVYLLPASNVKIRPMLEKQLRKGTRVVAHDFEISGWQPVEEQQVEDDGEGRSHTLYLYER